MTTESFRKETKIGLSYGQILSTLTLLILIGASYVNLKTDIATLTEKAQNNKERIEETSNDMKGFILENKSEHKGIMERLDKIIMYNSRKK
jgi:hypothetical protein